MLATYHPEGPKDSDLNFPRLASNSMDSTANLEETKFNRGVGLIWLSLRMHVHSMMGASYTQRFYLSNSFSSMDSSFSITLSLQEPSQPSAIPKDQCALFRNSAYADYMT